MTKLTLHLGSGKIVSTTLVPRAFFRRPVGNFRIFGGTPKKICSGNIYLIKMLYIHIGLLVKKTSQLAQMKHYTYEVPVDETKQKLLSVSLIVDQFFVQSRY